MRILILDDDRILRRELSSFLSENGHEVLVAENLEETRRLFAETERRPDLVLADLYLGKERGTAVIENPARVPVVMISGAGGIRDAVEALKAGAWDFLEKPVDPDRLLGLLRNLEREIRAERGVAALREVWLGEHAAFEPGSPFEAALEEAKRVAPSPLSVLVTGPSGSGKEVIARWVHYCSPSSGGPFVAVNCAAVPHELAESLFFGAKRGSYTGAEDDRQGWFQAADTGTLFLDELGEIPFSVQAKLLRVVESGEVQRLGSTASEKVSVRLVSATNRDLDAEAAAGRFREDLYWRLAQATIRVPPLSSRKADVRRLALWFLARARSGGLAIDESGLARYETESAFFEDDALVWLEARDWPGNVRELRDFVERARWLCPGPGIGAADLEGLASTATRRTAIPSPLGPIDTASLRLAENEPIRSLKVAKMSFEKAYIQRALAQSGGSVARAAAALDILPNNLSRKLGELGIARPAAD